MKLIVLDRDGVINVDRDDFVKCAAEWQPLPGSLEAIAQLNQAGYRVVVATNQSGIGRGLFDMTALNAMHAKMHRLLAEKGGRIDAVFMCPHAPADDCECRKPRAGLFIEIANRYGLDSLDGVPVVGDSARDLQAGVSTGCAPHGVLTGKGLATFEKASVPETTRWHADLAAFVQSLLSNSKAF